MKDPDLDTLVHAWRRADTDCLPTSPAQLSRPARSQAAVGAGASLFLLGFAAWAGVQAARGETTWGLLAAFAVVLALVTGWGMRGMRRTALRADALLLGPPVDVARGHRQHVYLRVCSLRSPAAVVASVSPIPLYLGLAAVGWVPWLVAGVTAVGWAACIAWMHLHTVPRLRAEVIRLDALIAALED